MDLLCAVFAILIFICTPSSCVPKKVQQENGYCGMNGYEAHCVLDIMEEHIEATAIVNHCHIPLDITFRVIYRYGNGSEQRWQYTFVSTNQNERVLIPGLALPPAPHALVYLYVRVPQPMFDLHNSSLVAIEASFIAVLSDDMWEEAEFLNEVITVNTTQDCYVRQSSTEDPLLWIIGGALIGLLLLGGVTTGILWWYRKRKLALDELALVSSIETGLPGAQPYQIGTSDQRFNNNNDLKEIIKETQKQSVDSENQGADAESSDKTSGFRFNRLKEESAEERKEKIAKKLSKAVVIGNPVLVDKTSVLQNRFNRVMPTSPTKPKSTRNVGTVGDAFKNDYSVDEDTSNMIRERPIDVVNDTADTELKVQQWSKHPLEGNDSNREENSASKSEIGARPKSKSRKELSHEEKESQSKNDSPLI